MSQIQPLKGESLVILKNTNPIAFVMFISIFFDLLYQRRYYDNFLWVKLKKCRSMSKMGTETGESLASFSKH